MNQDNLAKRLGISVSGLRKLDNLELAKYGWQKVGKGKGCFYRKLGNINPDEVESMEEAKKRKLIADANLSELKTENKRNELKREGAMEVIDAIIDILSVLPATYAKLNLTNEQNDILNKSYEEAINGIEKTKLVL